MPSLISPPNSLTHSLTHAHTAGLHHSTASKTNVRKSDVYSFCRRDKKRYEYYVTKLGGTVRAPYPSVSPHADTIQHEHARQPPPSPTSTSPSPLQCPESDLIEFSMLCAEAYQAVRKSWAPTGKRGIA